MNSIEKSNKELIYKFPYTDDTELIKKLSSDSEKLRSERKIASNIKPSDVSIGGKFDSKAFNKKLDNIRDLRRAESKIKDKIKLAKLKYRPVSYGHLTIDQLKQAMIIDIYDMCSEISHMQNISFYNLNIILSKNYRKLSILVLLLIFIIISYIIIGLLSED